MPLGTFVNEIPTVVFMVIHLAAFSVGVYLAQRSFQSKQNLFAWGFALFAVAEISYMTYHLDWTVFLFAHTLSEVLDLTAFVLVFAGTVRAGLVRTTATKESVL